MRVLSFSLSGIPLKVEDQLEFILVKKGLKVSSKSQKPYLQRFKGDIYECAGNFMKFITIKIDNFLYALK